MFNNATGWSDEAVKWIWDLRIGREAWLASPLFPIVLSISYYFICVIPLTICDLYFCEKAFWKRFKLQTGRPTTWPMVRRALTHVMRNNILYILPVSIAQTIFTPDTPIPEEAPKFLTMVWHLAAMLVIFDFQYGLWHLIHHKNRWLYRNFHSVHHQYHTSFALVGQYLHPWELFTIGFFTTVDPWFFKCHPLTTWVWMLANIWFSTEAHSGLDFPIAVDKFVPFFGGSRKHDMHHMRPLTNFQPYLSTWDRLWGYECPGMKAGGVKPKELIEWEEKNRATRMAKHATKLMVGTENGFLSAESNSDKKE